MTKSAKQQLEQEVITMANSILMLRLLTINPMLMRAIATATNRASGAELPSPAGVSSPRCKGRYLFPRRDDRRSSGNKSAATGGEFAPAYREGRDLIRGMEEQYRKDYPITATACAFDGIRLFCRRSRESFSSWRSQRKQPRATWRRCGNCGRIRVFIGCR